MPREIQESENVKAAETREGPVDLHSGEQASEKRTGPKGAQILGQALPAPGTQKMQHFLGRPLQLNLIWEEFEAPPK